jgi:hypothetical protein
MKLSEAKAYISSVLQTLENGCSNNGCVIRKRTKGQGTNSICQCGQGSTRRELARISGWMDLTHAWDPEDTATEIPTTKTL